jgi:hypothetical protein
VAAQAVVALVTLQLQHQEPQTQAVVVVVQVVLEQPVMAALASSSLNTTHPYNRYSHSKVLASG